MKIIDAHLHLANIQLFRETAEGISFVDYSLTGLLREQETHNIVGGIVMGLTESRPAAFPDAAANNPMLPDWQPLPENISYCLGINPHTLAADPKNQLARIAQHIQDPQVVGLKLYPGYYRYYVSDPIYQPILRLAADYELPVVIHGGDTYSPKAILKYAHPLTFNELIVEYPHTKFVIAHLGNPWVLDAAVLVANYPNVYADLSGLLLGGDDSAAKFAANPYLMHYLHTGIYYAERFDKLLFGSDWPLVRSGSYINFVGQLIPPEYHEAVFYRNALKVFPRLNRTS